MTWLEEAPTARAFVSLLGARRGAGIFARGLDPRRRRRQRTHAVVTGASRAVYCRRAALPPYFVFRVLASGTRQNSAQVASCVRRANRKFGYIIDL